MATLFDGRAGNFAPFKAEYVSSLVSSSVEAEIDRILKVKSLQDQNENIGPDKNVVNRLVESLRQEKKTGKFPLESIDTIKYDPKELKICIVGAGISGLYAAYVLEFLGIDYEILEANPERIGGRIFTHYFTQDNTTTKNHDYYDIGAMRFPNSPIMARTFDLFGRLNIGKPGEPVNPDHRLVPYYMQGKNCPTRYNDLTACLGNNEGRRTISSNGTEKQEPPPPKQEAPPDVFHVSTANGGTVPVSRVSFEASAEILDDAYERFRNKIKNAQQMIINAEGTAASTKKAKLQEAHDAMQRAYQYLLRHDKFSLREYLQNVEGYDPETVHWLETTDSATGWFDQAFTENVLESLAFSYSDGSKKRPSSENEPIDEKGADEKKTRWYCIEGGTQVVIQRIMEKIAASKLHKGKMVTAMKLEESPAPNRVSVTFRDHATKEEETRKFSAVINTTTLGALQKIDLTGMKLPYGMKTAIRVLRYDSSTKVGIRFKKMWWKTERFNNINLGGVAKTDMPIRVCVYPSYNIDDNSEQPGVLLASYSWGQDSERIAAHVSTKSPTDDIGLRELMVYNLARLHTLSEPATDYEQRFAENRSYIDGLWDTHHGYDWSKDPYSAGAFALFGPGQFTTLIPHLIRPASDARFVIVGEHASANHAWIVGALDSAVRGLKQILTRFGLQEEIQRMVAEFMDVDELKSEQVAKQVILATLTGKQMAELSVGKPVQVVANVPGAGTTL